VARRIDTEFKDATAGDSPYGDVVELETRESSGDSPAALIALADAKRGPRPGAKPPTTHRRKRRATSAAEDPFSTQATPGGSALDGVPPGPTGWFSKTGIRIWSGLALAAATALIVLSMMAYTEVPKPLPVSNVTISWLPGPRVADAEVLTWLRRSPQFKDLATPNEWVLEKLAEHLRSLPAVAEVRQVRLFHEPGKLAAVRTQKGKAPVRVQVDGIRRTVEIQLALRQPYLPAILRDGSRAWIDAAGIVLPGVLPSPGVQRPVVRRLEGGGREALVAAVDLWQRLEPLVEKGLITEIGLNDHLELQTAPTVTPAPAPTPVAGLPAVPAKAVPSGVPGIVLYTRQGTRLVWGRPGEERYGVQAADKVRDLVHTLQCQGDLSRTVAINVRFHEPYYVLR
jgi:hypothetical protein